MPAARTLTFYGRSRERQEIDSALASVRGGESAVLVIRGEAGIGKTALVDYCAAQASGCRLTQIAGVESELELPLAALHQLCGPMLADVRGLPEPQQRAIQVAFGMVDGTVPDRFVLGMAVLSALAEIASEQPLVCLVDDAQWLDEASSQVLGFVGRRLLAESVLLMFAVRETADDRLFPGMPELTVGSLEDDDARDLIAAAVQGHVDERVRDRVVAETGGNPLALLELVGGMSEPELAGGFAAPARAVVPGQLQDHYVRRIHDLPDATQRLLLVAAAEPTGDVTLLWRAAHALGLDHDAAAAAEVEQLLELGSGVHFQHPLVRSAAYAAGSPDDRRAAHLALADAIDAVSDAEDRIWHLAAAATGPDEKVAMELERLAETVQARAGLAASAAFLQRSVALTAEPERRAERALAAARANLHAGAFDTGLGLLAEAEADAVDDLQRAHVEQLRGQINRASTSGSEAPVLLHAAAKRLESLDTPCARETYLDAWGAALVAGRLAGDGGDLAHVSAAARESPAAQPPEPSDLLLDGLTALILDGPSAAASSLRHAVDTFLGDQVSTDDWLHWGALASNAAFALWDADGWSMLSARHVEIARAAGGLAPLASALNVRRVVALWCGDVETASSLGVEEAAVKDVTRTRRASYGGLLLAAYEGHHAKAVPLIATAAKEAVARGEGLGVLIAGQATAILHNGLGRYAEAMAAAKEAAAGNYGPFTAQVLSELVEAAARNGEPEIAAEALDRLSTAAGVEGSEWAAGILARCSALLIEGDVAEQHYAEAVERLARTPLGPELARGHLLYGEWLRRRGRRVDARHQLRAAYDLLAPMGAGAFAERARRELLATGEKVRKRGVVPLDALTSQEEHIARMARDGRTNAEIGAELYISARTVEWHLRKVFAKLGIASRRELRDVLPARGQYAASG